jgi:hypothetical protein
MTAKALQMSLKVARISLLPFTTITLNSPHRALLVSYWIVIFLTMAIKQHYLHLFELNHNHDR